LTLFTVEIIRPIKCSAAMWTGPLPSTRRNVTGLSDSNLMSIEHWTDYQQNVLPREPCLRGICYRPVSVRLSVTSQFSILNGYSIQMITHTTPNHSPGTLMPKISAKCDRGHSQWGGVPETGGVGWNRRISMINSLNLENTATAYTKPNWTSIFKNYFNFDIKQTIYYRWGKRFCNTIEKKVPLRLNIQRLSSVDCCI